LLALKVIWSRSEARMWYFVLPHKIIPISVLDVRSLHTSDIFMIRMVLNWWRCFLFLYIRMDLGEVGWGDMDWIGLAKDRNRWRALVNSVLNLRAPWNAGKLSSGLASSGLSSSAQFHRVS
jgi:hypothetical protein